MKENENFEHNASKLNPDVDKAVRAYLQILWKVDRPPRIVSAIAAIRTEYLTTGQIKPTQVAILQRCFHRVTSSRFEIDWLPIDVLDQAIAQELDGQPCRMLPSYEVTQAIEWLGIRGHQTSEELDWHGQVQEQLLLTGWLPKEHLMELRRRYYKSLGRRVSSK